MSRMRPEMSICVMLMRFCTHCEARSFWCCVKASFSGSQASELRGGVNAGSRPKSCTYPPRSGLEGLVHILAYCMHLSSKPNRRTARQCEMFAQRVDGLAVGREHLPVHSLPVRLDCKGTICCAAENLRCAAENHSRCAVTLWQRPKSAKAIP